METREPEAPVGPGNQPGYAERDADDDGTIPQTGDGGVQPGERGGEEPEEQQSPT